jgi:dipeptidyl aminopeptidase/acylaminoacyl peptidase
MNFAASPLRIRLAACALLAAAPGISAQTTAGVSPSAASPAPHFPTNEDLRHLKAIAAPQLSPDGKQVLFAVTDATADGAKSHLWLVSVGQAAGAADKARQITFSPVADKRGEFGAQWFPDGSAIFFLAKRTEQTQLFRLDMRGGEAAPYDLKITPPVDESKLKDALPPPGTVPDANAEKKTDEKPVVQKAGVDPALLPIDVSGYAFSVDGKWLAVWARDPETPGEKKQKEAKADASWVNHELHGTRLYLAALKQDGALDGALRPVAVAHDVHSAQWSPAADRLIVHTEQPNDASDLGPAGAAWIVDAAVPDKAVKLEAVPATVGRGIAWQADGGEIVFAAQTPEDAPPGYEELFALKLAVTGADSEKPRRLTAGFAGQLNATGSFYSSDGSLIAVAGVGTRMTPVRISLDAKTPPASIDFGASVTTGLNTNRKQTGWVWLAESGDKPVKLCHAQHLGDPCTPVSTPDLAPPGLRFVAPELVRWQNGGLTIEGLLYLPPQAAGTPAKVPLIVDVHGGPFGAFEDRNDAFAAFLVGHSWALLRPNPRGGSNYGVKFAAANKNDLGGGDYRDIMSGVDYALARYPLDPARMALIGYSYGGEMAGFAEVKTDRFKAIVSGAPVIDQFSEYGTEHGSWYDRWYLGKPWEHFEDAWRQSPLSGASRAKTPFLLLQGQSDATDPLGQAQEMYRALRHMSLPVELVTYPREDHGPLIFGIFGRPVPEPWHGFDARQRIVNFIEKGFGVLSDTSEPDKH